MTGLSAASFLAGSALGLAALVTYHLMATRRLRALAASIRDVGRGGDPALPRDRRLAPALIAAREIADARRTEQALAREREALLQSALEASPSAIVLFSDLGEIAFTNHAARDLFFEGADPRGDNFLAMLGRAPDALRRALAGDGDELLSIDDRDGERQTYSLARRRFELGGRAMVLVLVKNLSRELHRQEADAWKRMIRLFCHELNNSLAPVSSLVGTARLIVEGQPVAPKLERIFGTIAERTEHLRAFLESYAQFARLPSPRKADVPWDAFVGRLLQLSPSARIDGDLPAEAGWFDAGQLEQVAINLLRNATEAGGPPEEITIAVTTIPTYGARLTVADRGPGMSSEVIERALVPFYSTKERGSGLGLTLCREIAEAHGGGLRIENRDGGGLAVHVRIPARAARPDSPNARLTLTRT